LLLARAAEVRKQLRRKGPVQRCGVIE